MGNVFEMEQRFLRELYKLQKTHNAYWIQTKHITRAMFGETSVREQRTNNIRVQRLAKKLGVETTTQRLNQGDSTMKSCVKYYHTVFREAWLFKPTGERDLFADGTTSDAESEKRRSVREI